jgi:UDP-N-acetyl-D-mannosaminuronic acid dehydrogenase
MHSICVHGLGYLRLLTAEAFANDDSDVSEDDTSTDVTERLRDSTIHVDEGQRAFVTPVVNSGQLKTVDDVVASNCHVICVLTTFDEEPMDADMTNVEQVGHAIARALRSADIDVRTSTPRTTVCVLQPMLKRNGLCTGDDFALLHYPETASPGDVSIELRQSTRIIGGVGGLSTEAAGRLPDTFVEAEIRTTTDATTVAFVKLIRDTFWNASVALASEVLQLAHDSVDEAVSGADATGVTTGHDEFVELESVRELMNESVLLDSKGLPRESDWRAVRFAFRRS